MRAATGLAGRRRAVRQTTGTAAWPIYAMKRSIVGLSGLAVAGALGIALLSSCGFTVSDSWFKICASLDEVGLTEVVGDAPALVHEEPGTIKVMHGIGRATYNKGELVKVEQSAELPAYANRATVFVNGWRVSYNGGDQHLGEVGTILARIKVVPGKITWHAAGALRDEGEEEAFTWEYRYTIVAWNDANVRAMVDHNDADYFCKMQQPGAGGGADGTDNFFVAWNEHTTTALTTVASFLQNPGFAGGRQVAVLPRGFGFGWSPDHHLLQLGYNLESVAPYVRDQPYRKGYSWVNPLENTGNANVGGEFVSWKTSAIMKDDSGRRDYGFVEVVSAMGGPDVEIVQPEFSLLPLEDADGGLGGAGVKSAEVVIENLPYVCAVPMLTGWDIGFSVSDQHVKELGIWLDDVRYERPPGAATGTLRYKVYSVVRDDDDWPDNYHRHKVTVLGLKLTNGEDRDVTGRPRS